jgi:hypothetical protein
MIKPSITYESWVALDVEMLLADIERNKMQMAWRLWELALARMNNHGHAPFRKNELVWMACGRNERSDVQTVYRGLKNLADMGRIAPVGEGGSTLYCIRVNTDIAQRQAGRGNYKYLCSEPSHMDIRQEAYHTPVQPDKPRDRWHERERIDHEDSEPDPWADDACQEPSAA